MVDTLRSEGEPAEWSPPSAFDGFAVLQPIGAGGMGRVYLGRDVALDRSVALKFIATSDPTPRARERFLREARALAKLSHPNVVGVYRVGEVRGLPYIAYEFVSGQSLDKMTLPLRWSTALRLAVRMARGLEAAHAEGMLHRDIKPGNVMLSDRGEVKLLDFGLAKLQTEDHEGPEGEAPVSVQAPRSQEDSGAVFTGSNAMIGTPMYMAPELWWGDDASPRSDVFALGLVVYELICGRLPHAGLRLEDIARAIVEGTLPPLRDSTPEVPESLAQIIDRAVHRDALERYTTATELRSALEEVEQVFLPASGALDAIQMDPDRVAVGSSFARVRARGDAFIASVYERLFALSPTSRALFPPDMTEQRKKLLHALSLTTDSLNDPERMGPVLEDLGRRHIGYGVEPAHFAPLERALLGALGDFDGEQWTPALERAWRRGFAFIEAAMRRGMALARTQTCDDGSSIATSQSSSGVFRLDRFTLEDTHRLAAQLRRIGTSAADFEEAARHIVSHLFEGMRLADSETPACRLVRLFRTTTWSALGDDAKAALLPSLGPQPEPVMRCLALQASRGVVEEWNDPKLSRAHRLLELSATGRSPMVSALLAQLGLSAQAPFILRTEDQLCNVFHVEQAPGSPFVPDQVEFVQRHGIQSVLGFGGLLADNEAFAIILFCAIPVARETADLFRLAAPSVGLALDSATRRSRTT
jgi:serine/threonine protein kinase